MKPMIYSLPNNALFNDAGDPARCECGSERFQRRGFNYTRTRKYQRWQCQGCGSWYQGRKSVPLVTPEIVRVVR
jgi:transposase-like protein